MVDVVVVLFRFVSLRSSDLVTYCKLELRQRRQAASTITTGRGGPLVALRSTIIDNEDHDNHDHYDNWHSSDLALWKRHNHPKHNRKQYNITSTGPQRQRQRQRRLISLAIRGLSLQVAGANSSHLLSLAASAGCLPVRQERNAQPDRQDSQIFHNINRARKRESKVRVRFTWPTWICQTDRQSDSTS